MLLDGVSYDTKRRRPIALAVSVSADLTPGVGQPWQTLGVLGTAHSGENTGNEKNQALR